VHIYFTDALPAAHNTTYWQFARLFEARGTFRRHDLHPTILVQCFFQCRCGFWPVSGHRFGWPRWMLTLNFWLVTKTLRCSTISRTQSSHSFGQRDKDTQPRVVAVEGTLPSVFLYNFLIQFCQTRPNSLLTTSKHDTGCWWAQWGWCGLARVNTGSSEPASTGGAR